MAASAAGTRRHLVPILTALVITLAIPGTALGQPAPSADPANAEPAASSRFTLDLSGRGDFVAQTNFVQCVGASMQMMLNMIEPKDDRTSRTQRKLQVLARALSGRRPDGNQRQGASVRGWTSGLNSLGAGPYRTVGSRDIQDALKAAATAMRETGRPVGLLVWRGRHAWVMAGFTATADPRKTDDFKVLEAIVLDPLYPYGSSIWGESPNPRESISVRELGRQFVPRGLRSLAGGGTSAVSAWSQSMSGKYVIVMPYSPARSTAIRR